MKFIRLLSLFLLSFLLLLIVIKETTYAQSSTNLIPNSDSKSLNVNAQNVVMEVFSSVGCQLAGINITQRDQKCLGIDPTTGQLGFVEDGKGAVGVLTSMIGSLYYLPIHSTHYASYLSENFGIAKSTYAQGVGFSSISPLVKIWSVFRDLSYLFFVAVFIFIGFAIMLRRRIDPRTVMTVQNQIPRLIVSIAMITLSFGIAGFVIDLMWVSTYTVINIVGRADPKLSTEIATENLNNNTFEFTNNALSGRADDGFKTGGIFDIAQKSAGSIQNTINESFGAGDDVDPPCNDIFCSVGQFLGGVVDGAIGFVGNLVGLAGDILTLNFGGILDRTLGQIVGSLLGFIVSWIIGVVAFFVIIIAILFSLFKLWFALLKTYIFILVAIIFAPLWIVGGLIPGNQSLGFGSWLRNLVANVMVFPAVIGFLLLGRVFVDIFETGTFFVPPLVGGSNGINAIGPLIGLGFILMAPNIVDMVKKAFKAQDFGVGGAAIGTGVAVFGAPVGRLRSGLFGTDRNGAPQEGSAFIGRKFGSIAQGFSGGTFSRGATGGAGSLLRIPKLGKVGGKEFGAKPSSSGTTTGGGTGGAPKKP